MVPAGLFGMNLVAELFLTVILGGLCGWAACQLLRMPWHKGDFFFRRVHCWSGLDNDGCGMSW